MRITGVLCTFNDCDYLDAALTAFKGVTDKLYVIEGSWQTASGYKNTQKRSDENTYNILDKHIDQKKVCLIQANESSERTQRQVGLEKAKEDGSDWHWFLDSDEIYPPSVVNAIKTTLNRLPPNVCGLRLNSFNFINSFNRWYEGNYARIARVTPDAYFLQNNDVNWTNPSAEIQHMPKTLRYFHYCYVKKNTEQMWRKLHAHEVEDPSFKTNWTPQYGAEGHVYTIPSSIQQYRFTGMHPAVMKDHPNIKANIYNDEDIRFAAA